jgi:hypothetical protein
MATALKLGKNPTKQVVTRVIETAKKQIKFQPPKPADDELITHKSLGIVSERKRLEELDLQFLINYLYAIKESQENNESQRNTAFAKKFYPKRLSLLASLLLSIVMSKNLPNDLKYRALKFFHENFDIDEALIDKILTELEAIEPEYYIPFSNFNIEDDIVGYGLYNSFQDETIKYVSVDSSKGNALETIADNLKKLNDKLDKGNENLDRRLVIKPNPKMRMHEEEEIFNRSGMGSQQNLPENSQRSSWNPCEILKLEPRHTDESDEAFRKRLRKSYHKLILIHHPDKGGLKEDFQKIHSAYEELNKDLLTENETVRQNSPSRRPA